MHDVEKKILIIVLTFFFVVVVVAVAENFSRLISNHNSASIFFTLL